MSGFVAQVRRRLYRGPVPAGLLRGYIGRRVTVPHPGGRAPYHGRLLDTQPSELSTVWQCLTLAQGDRTVSVNVPLSTRVVVR